jgi:Kef-type K+ transport system membrane component KefB
MSAAPNSLVQDIGVCFVGAGVLSVIFERLRIPHVAAFLAAGALVGPIGLSLVTDAQNIETIAHLGLTLLMFLIGLEVDVKDLAASGRTVVLGGLLQVPLSIVAGLGLFGALAASGVTSDGYDPLYFAFACAFSSTLLVVKLLQTRLRLDSVAGRISVGLLIFQDIWAIVILAVQPNFAKPDIAPILSTFAGIGIIGLIAILVSQYVLPAAFRTVAKIPELVVTASLAWCFGLGLIGVNLGNLIGLTGYQVEIGVSLEMAALIAGTTIATFPYSYDVVTKVGNLRDFFVTLFFVALGMGIPVPDGLGVVGLALLLTVATLVIRAVVFFPLMYVGGLDRRHAVESSVQLAQISEFCLVIAYLGQGLGHIDGTVVSAIVFAFVITAVATPMMFSYAEPFDQYVGPVLERIGFRPRGNPIDRGESERAPRLVLLGFHRVASSLLHDLVRDYPDIVPDTLVVDFNLTMHPKIAATGARVVYGDIANIGTLEHAGVAEASTIVSTVPDDLLKGTNNTALAKQLRTLAPAAIIVVNAVRIADVAKMYEAGADYVFMARTKTSRGVLPVVNAALNGELASLIAAERVQYGDLRHRVEVLD